MMTYRTLRTISTLARATVQALLFLALLVTLYGVATVEDTGRLSVLAFFSLLLAFLLLAMRRTRERHTVSDMSFMD